MPLPKTPPLLQTMCLKVLVNTVVSACQRQPWDQSDIQSYCEKLPSVLANQYVDVLLKTIGRLERNDMINIQGALSNTRCTHVSVDAYLTGGHVVNQVVSNLDRMPRLTYLRIVSFESDSRSTIRLVSKQLQHLHTLKSLQLSNKVTDDTDLFKNLVRFCPDIEALTFNWDMSTIQDVTLRDCPKLKQVKVTYSGESDDTIVYILNSIPQLHTFIIMKDVGGPLLSKCHGPYSLKRFVATMIPKQLPSLAKHFPHLEELKLKKCHDHNATRDMVRVKSLSIVDTKPAQVSNLMRTLWHNLTHLSLGIIFGLQESLSSITCDTLRNIMHLTLTDCTEVDIAQICSLFPDVKDLTLTSNAMAPMATCRLSNKPFSELTNLTIYDFHNFFKEVHLEYILSCCTNLQHLLINCHALNNIVLRKILRLNPMDCMRIFSIESNNITSDVVNVVFEFFGDFLEIATFYGSQLGMTENQFEVLQKKIFPYELEMIVGMIEFNQQDQHH